MRRRTGNRNRAEPLAGELIPANRGGTPKRRQFRLTSARGVRRELAALYGEFRNGDVTAESARTASFILRCLLESIRIDEIESRLKTLEEHANVQPTEKAREIGR